MSDRHLRLPDSKWGEKTFERIKHYSSEYWRRCSWNARRHSSFDRHRWGDACHRLLSTHRPTSLKWPTDSSDHLSCGLRGHWRVCCRQSSSQSANVACDGAWSPGLARVHCRSCFHVEPWGGVRTALVSRCACPPCTPDSMVRREAGPAKGSQQLKVLRSVAQGDAGQQSRK